MKFKVLSINKDILNNEISPFFSYLRYAPKVSDLKHFVILMVSLGQEFRQDMEGMACICSMMSRASGKKT